MADPTVKNPSCPRCYGTDTVSLGGSRWECVSRVLRNFVPPSPSNLAAPLYGPCGFRFDLEQEERRQASAQEARKRAEEAKRREDARGQAHALEVAELLRRSDDPHELLAGMSSDPAGAGDFGSLIPAEVMRSTWARLASKGLIPRDEEIVVVEGRPNLIGFFQRHGETKTEWGTWRESARFPAFRAPKAGFRLPDSVPGSFDSVPSWEWVFDLLIDDSGALWRVDPIRSTKTWERMRGSPVSLRIVVDAGEKPRFRRGKRPAGWTTSIPNAGDVARYREGNAEYARALRGALAHLCS
jgi:hypothetical protein